MFFVPPPQNPKITKLQRIRDPYEQEIKIMDFIETHSSTNNGEPLIKQAHALLNSVREQLEALNQATNKALLRKKLSSLLKISNPHQQANKLEKFIRGHEHTSDAALFIERAEIALANANQDILELAKQNLSAILANEDPYDQETELEEFIPRYVYTEDSAGFLDEAEHALAKARQAIEKIASQKAKALREEEPELLFEMDDLPAKKRSTDDAQDKYPSKIAAEEPVRKDSNPQPRHPGQYEISKLSYLSHSFLASPIDIKAPNEKGAVKGVSFVLG